MQTIQLTCGSCQKLMAISIAHQGKQVRCPHCKSVVQAPSASAEPEKTDIEPMEEAPSEKPSWLESSTSAPAPERDSIFADREPTDDLFDEPPARVELPKDEEPPSHDSAEMPAGGFAPTPRKIPKQSPLGMYLLIFLIPYAVCTTGFVAYLLMTWPTETINRLEYLPDNHRDLQNREDKGKPKAKRSISQPAHDSPVPAKLRVKLGQTISIGEIEVTPTKVFYKKISNDQGDLVLELLAKNRSSDLQFCPVSILFLYQPQINRQSYVFLEDESNKAIKFFSGDIQYFKGDKPDRQTGAFDGIIGPHETATIDLETGSDFRKNAVTFLGPEKDFAKADKSLLWRVQVRRGLVNVRNQNIPLTALIGVEFTTKDIIVTDQ